jgi:hypothetical protein
MITVDFPELAFGTWTDWEIIEYMTDLYVSRLTPINHEAIQFEPDRQNKDVSFEKIYSEIDF